MTDQRKSPTEGQGFSNSFGGEYENELYSEITKKASGAKLKSAGPVFVTPCPPAENGGTLRALTSPVISKLSPLWQAGDVFHPYLLLQEARRAAANGRILLVAVIADGKEASFADKDLDSWLRGEVGK